MDHWKYAKHLDQFAMQQHLFAQQLQLEQALSPWAKKQKLTYIFTSADKPFHLVLCISAKRVAAFEAKRAEICQFVLALASADNNLFIQENIYGRQSAKIIFNIHINDTQVFLSPYPKQQKAKVPKK